MKISKNSWHYKFLTDKVFGRGILCESEVPRTLCGYFWTVVFFLGVFTVRPALAILLVVVPVVGVINIGLICTALLKTLFITGGMVYIGAILILGIHCLVLGIEHGIPWLLAKLRPSDGQKKKRPNILVEYIKTKKRKVCPLLEFEEK